MENQWISEIEELFNRYTYGDMSVLADGEKLLKGIPSSLKSLLYVSLVNFSLLANDLDKAHSYTKQAYDHFNQETQFIDEASLLFAETLPYFYQGKFEKSLQILINSNMDEHHQINFLIAEILYWSGEFAQATDMYRRASTICKNDENLQDDMKLCLLGEARCCGRQRDYSRMEEFLRLLYEPQVSHLDDHTEEVVVLAAGELARAYAMQGNMASAYDILEHSLIGNFFEHPYKKGFALNISGLVKFCGGDQQSARENFQSVIKLPIRKFDKLEAYLYIGKIGAQAGDNATAARCYRETVEFSETFFAAQARSKLEALPKQATASSPSTITESPGKQAAGATVSEASARLMLDMPITAIVFGMDMLDEAQARSNKR